MKDNKKKGGVDFEVLGSLIFGAILILVMWGLSVIL